MLSLLLACIPPADTGALEPSTDVRVDGDVDPEGQGAIAVPIMGGPDGSGHSVMVMNLAGEVQWEAELDPDLGLPLQARWAEDGESVWVWQQIGGTSALDAGFNLSLIDPSGAEVTRALGWGHTSFQMLPGEQSFLALLKTVEVIDGVDYLIDRVVEHELSGASQEVWSVAEELNPLDFHRPAAADAEPGQPVDWFHTNFIYQAPGDSIYLSLGEVDTLLRVDVDEGLIQGAGSQRVFVDFEGDPPADQPHSIVPLASGNWLVFNRGIPSVTDTCSHVAELHIDPELGTVERAWSWTPDDCVKTIFLGAALPLAGDRVLVDFASAGRLSVVNREGEEEVRIDLKLGNAFGQADWRP